MKKMLLCLGLAGALFAADNQIRFELTPTYNYNIFEGNLDLENSSAPGFRFGVHFNENSPIDQIELGFEHYFNAQYVPTRKTDISRYFVSLIKGWDLGESFYAYGLIGGGFEEITNELYDNKSDGFGHYGAGLKYRLTDSVALRFEVRDQITSNMNHSLVGTVGLSLGFGGNSKFVDTASQENTHAHHVHSHHNHAHHVEQISSVCDNEPRTGALLDENGCEKTITLEGHFASGAAVINKDFLDDIKETARILNENEGYVIVLEGHADSTGPKAFNQALSLKRAQNVAAELEKLGVDKSRIEVKAFGIDNPRSNNDTADGRADNRRVEAKFFLK